MQIDTSQLTVIRPATVMCMNSSSNQYFAVNGKRDTAIISDGHDKPFCSKAIMIIDNFKKALGDTDNNR